MIFIQIIFLVAALLLLVVFTMSLIRPRNSLINKYGRNQRFCRCGVWHGGAFREGWLIDNERSLILEPYIFGPPLKLNHQDIVECKKDFLRGILIKTKFDGNYRLVGIGLWDFLMQTGIVAPRQ